MAIVEKMAHNLWTHSPYASYMVTPLAALGASEEPIDKMEWGLMSIGDRDARRLGWSVPSRDYLNPPKCKSAKCIQLYQKELLHPWPMARV